MPNKHRGEISARLDDQDWCLCLTLGALAELESSLNVENLGQLADKFTCGNLSSHDLICVIGCGLRGGGHTIRDEEVRDMRVQNGLVGFAQIAADLISATFSIAGEDVGESSVNP